MVAFNDMLKNVKRTGDSKSDFFLPPAMERVAMAMAEHLVLAELTHIKAQLAATALREQLDEDACATILLAMEGRLPHMVKKARAALGAFILTVLKAADKASSAQFSMPARPPMPHVPRYAPTAPAQPHYYPNQHMRYRKGTGPEVCRAFAKGQCKFGNACKYLHEQGLPPPANKAPTPQAAPEQK